MKKIQNVIFDLGNVLLDYRPQEYLSSLFGDEELVARLYKAIFLSPEWLMLDRGVISQEEAVKRLVSQYPNVTHQVQATFADWFSMMTPIEASVEVLRNLKKTGYPLYVISNFHKAAFDYVSQKYDWFKLFDGMIISCDVRALKPEPKIYEALLEKYNLVPERSVFIDDALANVVGAQAFGIKGIHCQTTDQFKMELEVMLQMRF